MLPETITTLIETIAVHTGRSAGTIGREVSGSGDFYPRLKRGRDITTRRAALVVQRISNRWPVDLAWPPDTPRPEPSPDSPAAKDVA